MKKMLLSLVLLSSCAKVINANAESIESHQVVSNNHEYSEAEQNQKIQFQPVELDIELSPELDEFGRIKAFKIKSAEPKKVDMYKITTTF